MGQIFLFVPLPHSSLFLFLSPPPPAPACRLQRGERPFVSGNCNFSVFDFGQRRKRGDIWYSKLFSFSRAEPVSGVPRSRETSDRADKVTGAKLGSPAPLPLDSLPFPRYQNFGKQQSTETWRHQLFFKKSRHCLHFSLHQIKERGERRRSALPSNELRRALTSTENLSPQFQALFYHVRSLPSPCHFSLLLVGYKK